MNVDLKTAGEALRHEKEVSVLTAGRSMQPLFREHRDIVTVKRVENGLKKGDVVLYPGGDGAFILHRIMRIKADHFVIRGDNNYFTEYIPKDRVIGVLKDFYRGGKYVDINKSFKYKLYTFYICHSYFLRYPLKRIIRPFLGKIKRKIFK